MTAFDDADTLEVAAELLRIPSVSRGEADAARWWVEALAARGFRAHLDGAGNPVASIGEGPFTVALVGHIDTVPGEIPVRVEDGVLHGRGAVDAKGPLVAMAAAARRAVDAGAAGRFVVVGCVEEEVPSSKGAWHLARTWSAPPDALVIGEPSAWDGITLGYKGYLRARATYAQPSAHGAHDVESAPEAAAAGWARVRDAARAHAGQDASAFDALLARLLGMGSGHDGLEESAWLDLALRLPLGFDPSAARAWLERQLPAAQVVVRGGVGAWRAPRTTTLARALSRAILQQGGKPRFQVKTGTADSNILAPAWGCPTVVYGPGDAALDHTPEERVPVEELLRGVAVLSEALTRWRPEAAVTPA